jgi:hypothetical protein
MQSVTTSIDPAVESVAWARAAEDVASAMLSYRIKRAFVGLRPDVDIYECTTVQCVMYRYIPTAREAWEAGHPVHGGRCRCRQESLVVVGAHHESRMMGVDYATLVREGLTALHDYLDSRS